MSALSGTGEPRFGTDGVRGEANKELTAQLALKLGMAAAVVLGRHAENRHVVVGRDTRLSGDMLEAALNAGLAAMGARVTNIGVAPTPAVSRAVLLSGATAGAVISASHNPFADNGIKFFGADGRKLSDEVEEEIEAAMDAWESLPKPVGAGIGRIVDSRELVQGYIDSVRASAGSSLAGLTLVLDCANGAAYEIAPPLFESLGARVIALHTNPDGVNINENCGSTKPADLCARVVAEGADAGLAFDGDCDRVMICDEKGQIVDGDKMMAISARRLQRQGRLTNNLVVATIMSNAGLEVALESIDARLERTDVGDRYVAARMDETGAAVGGEQSGHILLPHLSPTGDGMVTGLQVLAEMHDSGKRLSELASFVQTCPQILKNVRVRDRLGWQEVPEIQAAIRDARAHLTKPEWLSVRASGTEPLVRVMAQDTDESRVRQVVDSLCGLIKERFGV
jgi:phosphoglucosamine mutase